MFFYKHILCKNQTKENAHGTIIEQMLQSKLKDVVKDFRRRKLLKWWMTKEGQDFVGCDP